MRTDLKIGVVLGAAVVFSASWYFLNRESDADIPLVPGDIEGVADLAPAGGDGLGTGDASPSALPVKLTTKSLDEIERLAATESASRGSPVTPDPTEASMAADPDSAADPDRDPASADTGATDTEPSDDRGWKVTRVSNRKLYLTPAAGTSAAGTSAAGTSAAGMSAAGLAKNIRPGVADEVPEIMPTEPVAAADRLGGPGRLNKPGVPEAKSETSPTPAPSPETPDDDTPRDLRTLMGSTPSLSPKPVAAHTVPTRTPKPQQAKTVPSKIHVVKSGDVLAILSEVYYGSQRHVEAILAANPGIKNPDRITVGMKIRIPPKSLVVGAKRSPARTLRSESTPAVLPGTYRIRPGDTLSGLAEKHYGSGSRWRDLLKLNRNTIDGNGRNLRVGQIIKLPAKLPPRADRPTSTDRARRR